MKQVLIFTAGIICALIGVMIMNKFEFNKKVHVLIHDFGFPEDSAAEYLKGLENSSERDIRKLNFHLIGITRASTEAQVYARHYQSELALEIVNSLNSDERVLELCAQHLAEYLMIAEAALDDRGMLGLWDQIGEKKLNIEALIQEKPALEQLVRKYMSEQVAGSDVDG